MKSQSYACYSNDSAIRSLGSSGGVYYHLASSILENNGVVYSACYEGTDVCHKRISELEELPHSCGSKYIPSRLSDTFNGVKSDIKEGREVLFVGTPCQCYGLKNYIGETDKLILIDFICHGIPSQLVWDCYIKTLSQPGKRIKKINMRDKKTGWENYSFTILYDDGTLYTVPHLDCSFIKGMLNDLYLRPSCYSCRFKGIERKTDITLGDLWGAKELTPEIDEKAGVSFVTIHSQKGEALFNHIKDRLVYFNVDTKKCAAINSCMVSSVTRTKERDIFFRMLQEGKTVDFIVRTLTRKSLTKKILNKLRSLSTGWIQ